MKYDPIGDAGDFDDECVLLREDGRFVESMGVGLKSCLKRVYLRQNLKGGSGLA